MFLSAKENTAVGVALTVCSLILSVLDLSPLLAGLGPSVGQGVAVLICIDSEA